MPDRKRQISVGHPAFEPPVDILTGPRSKPRPPNHAARVTAAAPLACPRLAASLNAW
jgi:hypothetical protein